MLLAHLGGGGTVAPVRAVPDKLGCRQVPRRSRLDQAHAQRLQVSTTVTCASSAQSSSGESALLSRPEAGLDASESASASPAAPVTAEAASVSPPSAEEAAGAEPSSTEGNRPKVPAEAEAGPSSSVPAERVADEDRWFRDGDVVVGRVTWANARGARVELLAEPRLTGYMPVKEGPYYIKSAADPTRFMDRLGPDFREPCLPVGTVREFQVLKVPQEMQYNGRGPLLSARLVDLDLLWGRAEQLGAACMQGHETMTVSFTDVNDGGLMTWFGGLTLFLPLSQVNKDPGVRKTVEELKEELVGKPITVTVTDVDPRQRRFTCSERTADYIKRLNAIKVGGLVWGTVRRLQSFGAFVGLDGVGKVSGLLHISNVSRQRVDYIEDVFQEGDRVRAVVLGMDEDYTRISLSTAELEEQDGDMLRDKAKVFENAEQQHKLFLEEIQKQEDQGFGEDGDHFQENSMRGIGTASYDGH